jgi:hypothetical protein
MSGNPSNPEPASDLAALAMRLSVLEMAFAQSAARLPQGDLEAVVSLLVFVAKGTAAAEDLDWVPADAPNLALAQQHATALLERILASRRTDRPEHSGEASGLQ